MEYIFEIVIRMITLLLSAFQIAIIIRVIFEFFTPDGEDNTLLNFARVLTEPGLILCDKLLSLLGIKNNGPFDITVMVSLFLAAIIKMTLSALI